METEIYEKQGLLQFINLPNAHSNLILVAGTWTFFLDHEFNPSSIDIIHKCEMEMSSIKCEVVEDCLVYTPRRRRNDAMAIIVHQLDVNRSSCILKFCRSDH